MTTQTDDEERYLSELIRDFGTEDCPEASDALRIIKERYNQLWDSVLDVAHSASITEAHAIPSVEHIVKGIEVIVRGMHFSLYTGILRNAGQYRKDSDPKNGVVWFGGQDRFYRGVGKYKGCDPSEICARVEAAARCIVDVERPRLEAVLMFYQKFVRAHPFYDANGRIARLVASAFLRSRGIGIKWDEMETMNREFLHRLNYCHRERASYPFYIGVLVSWVKKFVFHVDPSEDG